MPHNYLLIYKTWLTFATIPSACVSEHSSSIKIQEMMIGSIASSLLSNPMTSAVNGICLRVVASVHRAFQLFAEASFNAVTVSPITSTTTRHWRTKLTEGRSAGVSPYSHLEFPILLGRHWSCSLTVWVSLRRHGDCRWCASFVWVVWGWNWPLLFGYELFHRSTIRGNYNEITMKLQFSTWQCVQFWVIM